MLRGTLVCGKDNIAVLFYTHQLFLLLDDAGYTSVWKRQHRCVILHTSVIFTLR